MAKISPSILSANFSNLGEEISRVEAAGADYLHVDVMDGQFVPNITIGPVVMHSIKNKTHLPMHAHLMIFRPELYFQTFADAGAKIISFHAEAVESLAKVWANLMKINCLRAVAINPNTELAVVEPFLPEMDLILVMSVFPGFAGQKFIPEVLTKVERLKQIRAQKKYHYLIEIDGGINLQTAQSAVDAGCDILVAGSAVFSASDPAAQVRQLKKIEPAKPAK